MSTGESLGKVKQKQTGQKSMGNRGIYQGKMPITLHDMGKNYFKSGMHSHTRAQVEGKILRKDDSWKLPPKKSK